MPSLRAACACVVFQLRTLSLMAIMTFDRIVIVAASSGLSSRAFQAERANHGPGPDRPQQNSVKLWSAHNLLTRNERKQCPIGASDEEKTNGTYHRSPQAPVMPGVANPGHDRIADAFGGQTLTARLRGTPPPQRTHHSQIAGGVEPERRGYAESGDDCSSKCRTDRTADVKTDAIRRNGRCEVLLGNERWHDRLPAGSAQGPSDTYQEGKQQQNARRDEVERDESGEQRGDRRDRYFHYQEEYSPVGDIRERSRRDRQQEYGQRGCNLNQ